MPKLCCSRLFSFYQFSNKVEFHVSNIPSIPCFVQWVTKSFSLSIYGIGIDLSFGCYDMCVNCVAGDEHEHEHTSYVQCSAVQDQNSHQINSKTHKFWGESWKENAFLPFSERYDNIILPLGILCIAHAYIGYTELATF